tara:strand:- start:297 stop:488 length:192 start_codon:yes stop_codon:yes gene_type:complete
MASKKEKPKKTEQPNERMNTDVSDVYDFDEPEDNMRLTDFDDMNAPLMDGEEPDSINSEDKFF